MTAVTTCMKKKGNRKKRREKKRFCAWGSVKSGGASRRSGGFAKMSKKEQRNGTLPKAPEEEGNVSEMLKWAENLCKVWRTTREENAGKFRVKASVTNWRI